jgi:sugar phosphate isomerase/epimerase
VAVGAAVTLVLAAGSMLDVGADELVSAAAAAGFDGVGARVTGPHAPPDARHWREAVTVSGLSVHDAEVHRIGAGPADATVATTAELGIGRLLVVSDLPDLDETTRQLERVVELAAGHGVTVGLEYMAWTTPSNPADAIAVASRTGCTIVVDLLHHVRVGADVDELTAIVESGRLGWVQLCDAPATAPATRDGLLREARHERLAPGSGELPLARLVECVPAGTVISVEVQSDDLLTLDPMARAGLLHEAARRVLRRDGPDHPRSTG